MAKRRPDPNQLALDFSPWTTERLIQVLNDRGVITSPYILSISAGTLQDPSVPYSPRSYSFPVSVELVDGAVRLWLRTPATGALPFVKRVEAVLGVRAVWDESRVGAVDARWHHAVDLVTDGRWRDLLDSREHTEDRMIVRAAQLGLEWGKMKPYEAREILAALGIEEPADRSDAFLFGPTGLRPCRSVQVPNLYLTSPVEGWGMVHAFEDGWVRTVKGHAKVTSAYWQRVDGRAAA
ncbi:hypothetical protein [Methylobacterium sp. NFXW15]|uniref:hypothetical protein n=1 Tax=Methylobacterium sp. NFXW15 TaxID=2819512 RepID=UPI003CF83F70